jgi:hypothetical protein
VRPAPALSHRPPIALANLWSQLQRPPRRAEASFGRAFFVPPWAAGSAAAGELARKGPPRSVASGPRRRAGAGPRRGARSGWDPPGAAEPDAGPPGWRPEPPAGAATVADGPREPSRRPSSWGPADRGFRWAAEGWFCGGLGYSACPTARRTSAAEPDLTAKPSCRKGLGSGAFWGHFLWSRPARAKGPGGVLARPLARPWPNRPLLGHVR